MGGAKRSSSLPLVSLTLLHLAVLAGSGVVKLNPPVLTVTEGGRAIFSCTPFMPSARPILQVNGSIFIASRNPRITFSDADVGSDTSRRIFTLHDVTREDNGTRFQCIISIFPSNTLTLHVVVPPRLLGPSGIVTVLEGKSTTLLYEVSGDPLPHSVAWLREGVPFSGNRHISIGGAMNNTFAIEGARRDDSGRYELVARTTDMQASLTVRLQVAYNEFLMSPQSAILSEGDFTELQCVHRFGWIYVWYSNQRFLYNQDDKVRILNFGRTIRYGPVDTGDHKLEIFCIAQLRSGDVFQTDPAIITIRSPPVLTVQSHVQAVEGDTVILRFAISGYPHPLLHRLLHNDRELTIEEENTAGESVVIRFDEVSRADAGSYTAVVVNSLGVANATTYLEILYAPIIRPLTAPVVAQINRMISLPCGAQVLSNPAASFTWRVQRTNNPSSYMSITNSRFTVDTITGELVLSTATYSDARRYQCRATNEFASATTVVTLLVLDPPNRPQGLQSIEIGSTWAVLEWSLPFQNGNTIPISGYRLTASPIPTNYSDANVFHRRAPTLRTVISSGIEFNYTTVAFANSACVEVKCEDAVSVTGSDRLSVNITGLIPFVIYSATVSALANGTNLESEQSHSEHFLTLKDVPGIGSVSASIYGPGSMQVEWTLAFSGGSPLLRIETGYRRLNTTQWLVPHISFQDPPGSSNTSSHIPPHARSWVINTLEASEIYHFRVRAISTGGIGGYTVSDAVLSHSLGIPSTPAQPSIVHWTDSFATIRTSVRKLGTGRTNDSILVSVLLLRNGSEVARHAEVQLYEAEEELLVVFPNVSFKGEWQFQVFVTNEFGDSRLSQPSLTAGVVIIEVVPSHVIAGAVIGTILGVLNAIIMVTAVALGVVMMRESLKHKETLARRVEIAQASLSDEPYSPRSTLTCRDSPDGKSNLSNTNETGASPVDDVIDEPLSDWDLTSSEQPPRDEITSELDPNITHSSISSISAV